MNTNTITSSDIHNRGFSLVELVLYVALMGVFIVAIATLLTSMYEIRERHSRRTEVEQQGLAIMQTLRYIITESTEIISPLPGASSSTLSVNTESPTDNPTVLQIEDDILTVAK